MRDIKDYQAKRDARRKEAQSAKSAANGQRQKASTPAWLHIIGPSNSLDAASSTEVVKALHSLGVALALEIRISHEGLDVGICCADEAEELVRAVLGAAPNWDVSVVDLPSPPGGALRLVSKIERPESVSWSPLKDIDDFKDSDPLSSIAEAVQPLAEDEQLLIRYLARPASADRLNQIARELTVPSPPQSLFDFVSSLMDQGVRIPRFEASIQRALEQRLNEPCFEIIGAVALAGGNRTRLESRARSLKAVFLGRFDAGFGGLHLRHWSDKVGPSNLPLVWHPDRSSQCLSAGELAALWHLPSNRVSIPGVSRLRRPTVILPRSLEKTDGLLLGTHRQRGTQLQVRLDRRDLEAGHMAVIGRTGVGKSTLVHRIVHQLVAAVNGPGVGIIDPHGDLSADVATRSVPPFREKDVVFVDTADTEFPVGLPIFSTPSGVPPEIVVQTTFAALRLIFREHWSPTRMEDAVFAITSTLVNLDGGTLLDVPRLFGELPFRRLAMTRIKDPIALQFWSDYEALSESAKREVVRPILYRIRAFYRSPAVRNLVCQSRGLNFRELLDHRSVLLVSLAGPGIQAEADVLGELIIAQLHLAALGRLARRREDRLPFYLAVDESQRFRGASLPILLSEGRKLGLPLILSTQFIDAWGESLSDSVLGNVGTLVAFRCGPTDSRRLASSLKPFTPDQLEDLDRYEAIVKLQAGGSTASAFDIRTVPPNDSVDEEALDRIRDNVRSRYARPRLEVEAELQAKLGQRIGNWEGVDVDEE